MSGLLDYKAIPDNEIMDAVLLHLSDNAESGVSWVADVNEQYIWNVAMEKTMMFHRDFPNFLNKKASYYVGSPKRSTEEYMRGLYFLDLKELPSTSTPENENAIEGQVQWVDR